MFVNISIHRPHPDKEILLIQSMHRYGEAAKRQKGLVSVHTLKDESAGELERYSVRSLEYLVFS